MSNSEQLGRLSAEKQAQQYPEWVEQKYRNSSYQYIPHQWANSGRIVNKETGVVEKAHDDQAAMKAWFNNQGAASQTPQAPPSPRNYPNNPGAGGPHMDYRPQSPAMTPAIAKAMGSPAINPGSGLPLPKNLSPQQQVSKGIGAGFFANPGAAKAEMGASVPFAAGKNGGSDQLGRFAALSEKRALSDAWRRTLTGAGIGSLLGYLDDASEDNDGDSVWDGVLTGGLVGGGLGYGYHALRDAMKIPTKVSERPSSTRSDAKSLDEVLPEGYREDAQRHAQEYRDSIKGSGNIDSADIDKPFAQDISDRSIDRKVDIKRVSPEDMGRHSGGFRSTAQYELFPGGREQISVPPDEWGLAHELTHASQDHAKPGTRASFFRPSHKDAINELLGPEDKGVGKDIAGYLAAPTEEEAYLADIKRLYFKNTGKHVKNPEDAGKAIRWLQNKHLDAINSRGPGSREFRALRKLYGSENAPPGEVRMPLFDRFLIPSAVPSQNRARNIWIEALKRKMPGLVQNNTRMPGMGKQSNEMSLEKKAWLGRIIGGVGKILRSPVVRRHILPPAMAGGAGYAASPYIADQAGITSDMGRTAHRTASAGTAAMLASPLGRKLLFKKPQGLKAALKGLPADKAITGEAIKSLAGQTAWRPIAGPLTATGMIAAPTTIGAYSDPAKRFAEHFDKILQEHPERVTLRGAGQQLGEGAFEGALGKEKADKFRANIAGAADQMNEKGPIEYVASSPTAKKFLGAGTGLLGGSALGYGTGALLGKLLMPEESADYEELDEAGYRARRNRDRVKSILKLVGMYGGSLAGGLLGKKYLPGLIDKLAKKEASVVNVSQLGRIAATIRNR